MRIGISCYPTVGGSGAVATELGKALARRGHQVHFIVSDVPFRLGEFHHNIFIHDVQTTTYPVLRTPPHDFALAARMADVALQYQLDILHVHYALPFAVCALLAKQILGPERALPVVTTLHGTDITVLAQDRGLHAIIKLGIEQSDAVTAVSRSLAAQTRELFQTDKPIRCIYNFVDTEVFRPQRDPTTRACFASPEEKLLLHVSNFRAIKRISDVIRIFDLVSRQVPSRLLLVGEGPDLPAARELARQLGLYDRVRFLGKQDEVAAIFALADLFLLPSEKESFGLVALESMASGVPVIGSTAGGIPEVVVHGETGYLADVGDVAQMAAYAVRLLTDDHLYARMAAAARQRAETHFRIDQKVEEYLDVYEQVLATTRR
ncbi:glycosyl transferase [Alicyclobacillus cellulosilyticus]|uniref:Glycosyl transferase n=1 Tax=Alicyclobacillus cellulosilyticus TaxID=1003997 RepID=A0A917KAX4_9BACL|nr:N-acetyl-alpha-D-glucosaminyl L-malate synthase BshA [Alicyclobacillus cellulosilyticus]GGJ07366.1 glycosyl transferase [Alicyclobacillus cellulosilyticus]